MYNGIVNINIINKIILLVVLSLIVIFTSNLFLIYFIVFMIIVLSLLSGRNTLFVFAAISGLLVYFQNYNEVFKIIYPYTLLISIIILFIYLLGKRHSIYLFEKLLYRRRKSGRFLISLIYGSKVEKELIINYENKECSTLSNKVLNRQVKFKKENRLDDIYLISRLRFYNYYKRRRHFGFYSFSILDYFMLLFSIILLLLLIYWR